MGDITPPTTYTKSETYILKVSGNKSLKLSSFETDNKVHLFIGGAKKYCIYGTVHKENSEYVRRGIYDKKSGDIEQIYYNSQCSLEHDFVRGLDTNMIIHLLASYIRNEYPYVEYLQFNDASNRTCDNGITTDLAAMTFIYSGKTWYEKNFHAIMLPSRVQQFSGIIDRYNKKKATYTWSDFKELFIKGELPLNEDTIRGMYESSDTWQFFFSQLVDQIGVPTFCNFISPWLTPFVRKVMGHEFISIPYLMQISKLKIINYNRVVGGRLARKKFTRRRLVKASSNEM